MTIDWKSESECLPRAGQSVLVLAPRLDGEWWDLGVARLAVRDDGVELRPVPEGGKRPTAFWWDGGRGNVRLVTGEAFWACTSGLNLPAGAEHVVLDGWHAIAQVKR